MNQIAQRLRNWDDGKPGTTPREMPWPRDLMIEAADEIDRLTLANEWLREGLEEIGRATEPRAGNNDRWAFGVVCGALRNAGIPVGAAGIQKPEVSLDPVTTAKQGGDQ
jgi:hypothetical protein